MTKKDIHSLLERYINDTATTEERRWIETHYVHLLGQFGGVADKKQVERSSRHLRQVVQEQTQIGLYESRSKTSLPLWFRYAAAILVFLAAGGGIYWIYMHHSIQEEVTTPQMVDVLPGGNRATLTIANGQTVELSTSHSEIITGDRLQYADGTAVIDQPLGKTAHTSMPLTLTTPKGGTYQVVLPDGTQVWLNAGSVLKYPSEFASDKRVVALSGEAYFSVTKDAARPFQVISKGQKVEVLGTEFNISAYDDEPTVKSTLIEGRVRVSRIGGRAAPTVLRPGQQAILQGEALKVRQIEVDQAIAWKEGRFSFADKPFQQVMRELARWYDIEIKYEGAIPKVEFYGGAFRNHNLSTVLRLLESAELQYHMEGKTLVVRGKQSRKGGTP